MPRVRLTTHGTIDGCCRGSNRLVRARIKPMVLRYFGGGGIEKIRENSMAWCRWCKSWVSYRYTEEKANGEDQ